MRFLLAVEAAKTIVRSSSTYKKIGNRLRVVSVQFCIFRQLAVSLFPSVLCKVQHEAEYRLPIVNHGMALQLLTDRDRQDNLYHHSVG